MSNAPYSPISDVRERWVLCARALLNYRLDDLIERDLDTGYASADQLLEAWRDYCDPGDVETPLSLINLAEDAGGWFISEPKTYGLTFVPMDEWLSRYAEWLPTHPAPPEEGDDVATT